MEPMGLFTPMLHWIPFVKNSLSALPQSYMLMYPSDSGHHQSQR